MGNTASSQRPNFLQRDDRRFQEIIQERSGGTDSDHSEVEPDRGAGYSDSASILPSEQAQQRTSLYSTLRTETSAHSVPDGMDMSQAAVTEDITGEQEDRPLVGMGESGLRDATMTDFPGRPLSRQPSTMSRLGSRFLPDSVVRGLLNSGEETPAEGRALRFGSSASERVRPSVFERRLPRQANSRISLRESLRSRAFTRSGSRRQSIRGPFPVQPLDGPLFPHNNSEQRPMSTLASSSTDTLNNTTPLWRRRARLNRVRDSLSLHNLFRPSPDRSQPPHPPRTPPGRPSRVPLADESDHLLPPLPYVDHRLDVEDAPHELDAIEPEARNVLSSARSAQNPNNIRRFPHTLRSRSTRLIRRGEHPPLSQVLQLAAAAIAAQLSGQPNPTINSTRTGGGEPFDGTIQNFVQTLQEAATAQAGENLDGVTADGSLPPVNFMRVFQFPNNDSGPDLPSQGRTSTSDPMDIDDSPEETEHDRTVTLVLVGVRSMPSNNEGSGDENGHLGPSLDTLLSLPFLPPTNFLRNGSSGALFRRSDGRPRTNARGNSPTNFNSFPAQYESQRHQRTQTSTTTSTTTTTPSEPISLANPATAVPTVLSDTPPGPHPPPSTPADPRSGTATPSRRPSSASAVHSSTLPNLLENPTQTIDSDSSGNSNSNDSGTSTTAPSSSSSFNTARQRRRSDSEFARRPELSSGAARRNGVVEPDTPLPPAPPAPGTTSTTSPTAPTGRSWLIYVVGTNVSPDHPAFTMPSLFTDNPSYEDMQLLSTLLGPVKPPVATQEDVSSAGGVYRVVRRGDALVAEPWTTTAGPGPGNASTAASASASASPREGFVLLSGDRCLICLCDYEPAEEVRQLSKCRHVYHRECIDEWLTTGRNSCPMCRGQGVDEKRHATTTTSSAAPQSNAGPAASEVD